MRRWSTLFALVAAMLLAIAGGPSAAQEAACDPCPPDCPMMLPDSAAPASDHDSSAPADQKGKAPCQQTVLCQAAPVVAPAPIGVAFAPRAPTRAIARWTNSPEAPSRPPDRTLRPPKSA